MQRKNIPYLIIGGTTKAATTSVFNYLSAHPQVAKSKYKEMRFFLDDDYPLEKKVQFGSIADYNANFENYSEDKTCVEATPDYLYSSSSLGKIKTTLPDFKLIFILRDPVTRLQSWFNFAKQNNSIAADCTIKDYFLLQQKRMKERRPQYLLALEQGLYSNYLKNFLKDVDKEKISIIFYEDIATDPKLQMQKIANFAGIDRNYFDNYTFEISNKTVELKNPEMHARIKNSKKKVKQLLANSNGIRKLVRKTFKILEPIYLSFNKKKTTKVNIEKNILEDIREYYQNEKQAIYELTGVKPPWN